jgi:hypothetical protein
VGFLERALASGSPYKPTADGLRRKPILFVFSAEYAPAFVAANTRAAAARGRGSRERRKPVRMKATIALALVFAACIIGLMAFAVWVILSPPVVGP